MMKSFSENQLEEASKLIPEPFKKYIRDVLFFVDGVTASTEKQTLISKRHIYTLNILSDKF